MRSALNFPVGSISGTVAWHGAVPPNVATLFVAGSNGDPNFDWEAGLDADGSFSVANIPVGSYSLQVNLGGCSFAAAQSATVNVGANTPVTIDLDTSGGSVTGILALNGAAQTGTSVWISDCGIEMTTDGAGRFAYEPLPAGTHTANFFGSASGIFGPFGYALGTLDFPISAGGTTDVGVWNVGVGGIAGTVSWNGDPVSSWPATVHLHPPGFGWTWEAFIDGGGFAVSNLVPGPYDASVALECGSVAARTLTVTAGSTTTAGFDLTALAGRATVRLTSAGAPVASGFVTLCGYSFSTDDAGTFITDLLPVGTYTAQVYTPFPYTLLGPLTVTIAPGVTADLGTVDLQPSSLAVEGNVTWNGTPVTSPDAFAVSGYGADGALWWRADLDPQGHYLTTNIQSPGSYSAVVLGSCGEPIGAKDVNVSPGVTANGDVDLTATAGRVTGSIAVNGAPSPGARLFPSDGCSAEVPIGTDGHFATRLMHAGSYMALLTDAEGNPFDRVLFIVAAGQTTDVGTLNARPGSIAGTVTWNGAPLGPMSEDEVPGLYFAPTTGSGPGVVLDANSNYAASPVPPDTYTVFTEINACDVALPSTVTVPPGGSVVLNPALEGSWGKVTGTITFNGVPAPQTELIFQATSGINCEVDFSADDNGRFSRWLPAGSYTAWTEFGMASFQVKAGQVTDLDGVATAAGSNVTLDIGGGIAAVGGVSLQFSQVLQPGFTSVVATGTGPPPPTGYQIVGFSGQKHYWNIDSSATYSGPIRVCIHYDQAWISGSEALLRLVHDAGAGFLNITSSLNTTTNVVCGVTSSLSPFAIVEPEGIANTPPNLSVPANMTIEATGAAGAQVTFDATATDAEDGPLAAGCVPASGSTFPLGTTGVVCTATDSAGAIGTASFTLTVGDTTPPALSSVPDTIVAYATSAAGATVAYATPAATDAVDGVCPVSCTPAPGALFPLARTTVTCTASDSRGNASSATFTISVQVQAPTGGSFFLQPINADGSSIFKLGSTVPVKFALQGASAGITNLVAHLTAAKITNSVTGTYVEAVSTAASDSGNTFRYDAAAKQYVFNLSTKTLQAGTWLLRADLGDRVDHVVQISLR